MNGKRLLWVLVFLILLVSGGLCHEKIGVSIPLGVSTYTQNNPINNATDTSGGPTYGIYVLGNSTDPALSLTVNATVNSTATNSTGRSSAYGVYSYNETDPSNSRPLSNLVVTENGNINATAEGSSAVAYGVYVYSINGDFTNTGTISTTATSDGDWAGAAGVFAFTIGGDFSNTGNIYASANSTQSYAGAYGVWVGGDTIGGNFVNTGTISATATGATEAYAYGVEIGSIDGNFTNSGTISAVATAGNNSNVEATGIYINSSVNNFTNSGNISAIAKAGDAETSNVGAKTWGVYIAGGVDNFVNSGTIKAEAQIGDNRVEEDNRIEISNVNGVYINGRVGSFSNNGNIYVNATAGTGYGGDSYYSDVYIEEISGIYLSGGADTFNNSGLISVQAKVGDSEGYYTWAGINDIYGVYFGDEVYTFTNSGTISVTAQAGNANGFDDSEAYAEKVYGVYIDGAVDTFTNSGTISVTAQAGNANGFDDSEAYAEEVYGVRISGAVDSFVNKGDIKVNVQAGSAIGDNSMVEADFISGVEIRGQVNNFLNSGNILVSVNVGNASGIESLVTTYNPSWNAGVYGVYIGNNVDVINFTNLGNIGVAVKAGSAIGDNSTVFSGWAIGVDIGSNNYGQVVNSFVNNGTISVSVSAGDAKGTNSTVWAFAGDPVWVDYSTVNSFKNTGTIISTGQAGSALGNGSKVYMTDFGNGFLGEVGNFTNEGKIITKISAGDAVGTESAVLLSLAESGSAYGVYFEHIVDKFLNKGLIYIEASAGNALGANSTVYVGSVYGVSFVEEVNNFTNEGTIYVGASAGSASGENSTVGIGGILGVFADDVSSGSLVNKGLIQTSVRGGSGSEIEGIFGLILSDASDTTISNEGTIYVDVNAPNAKSVHDIAGIVISDSSNVTLSNPGTIWLSVFGPKPENVRTLYIENSEVTLDKSFSIVFGSPGIDPSTNSTENLSLRPIYVDLSSTLNLNSSDLIARIDSRNLKFNTKYYLIHKEDGGTVNEEWGSLVKGYANSEVTVAWAGEDYGENSAVIFGYVPGSGSMSSAMGYAGSYIISKGLANLILSNPSSFYPLVFGERGYKPVMLASASANIPVSTTLSYNRGFFFIPIYTRVDADDLGFDANAYGFALGLEGKIGKNLTATLYGGYSNVDLDFNVKGPKEEDQDLYMAGLALNYVPKPYFVRFWVAPHWADHDYKGLTGANYELKEKANYDSWGVDTELTGGYIFERGNVFIAPEIGLGYTYYRADDFHTKVSGASQWNRYYDTDEVSFLKGILGVYVAGKDRANKVMFYGSLRLEQAFGENDVSVISYLQGLPRYKLEQDISDTTITGQAGLNFKLGKQWMLDIVGRGDFNADYSAYSAQAILRYSF